LPHVDLTAASTLLRGVAVIPGSPATAAVRHLLTELAGGRHTGALHVDGDPGGTFYLAAGRITYAGSPACPGIGTRLVASGRLAEATWRAAYRAGYAECRVGAVLVHEGQLAQGELVCRVLAGICDATQAILQGTATRFRFATGERHWLGQVTQLELTALARETARRLELDAARPPSGAGFGPGPGAGPAAGPAANELPMRRTEPRTTNTGPLGDGDNAPRFAPDYATLRRIRKTLKSLD
jgi:hypothetical protein